MHAHGVQALAGQACQISQPLVTFGLKHGGGLWLMRHKDSPHFITHFKRLRANAGAQPSYYISSW